MSGSRRTDFKVSEIVALIAGAVLIIAVLAMAGALVWPKIEANWFPTPTPEPGISRIYNVRHDDRFECDPLAIDIGPPLTKSYVISALANMRTSNAFVLPDGERLEGWTVHWMYDATQERLEYWMYGAGSGDGLVFELLPRCFAIGNDGFPYAEFSEVEVRELNRAGEGNH